MKIILSRKGFDSSSGGCPSPILPDGRLLTLPIPDASSPIRYRDIHDDQLSIGKLVSDLTRGRIKSTAGAHLDPDLQHAHLSRDVGWQPLLGQTGSAQGHLAKQGVDVGDLFLFFGLFRPVERFQRKWRFVPGIPARHILWGWMQIGEVLKVDDLPPHSRGWLGYHPHCQGGNDPHNTLYLAANQLSLPGSSLQLAGSGTFACQREKLVLTAPDQRLPSQWLLPSGFFPNGRQPLSYHDNLDRWSLDECGCHLRSVARGQEFVLNIDAYPALIEWISELLNAC